MREDLLSAPLEDLSKNELIERCRREMKNANKCIGQLYRDIGIGIANKTKIHYYKRFGEKLPFHSAPMNLES